MTQHALYCHGMNYGERLSKAMEGRFATNALLADALTKLLHQQKRIPSNKVIPEETIQSARSRITPGGQSKYTLDFAKLCEVDAYWLAYEVGVMRPPESLVKHRVADGRANYSATDGLVIEGISRDRWNALSPGSRRKIEGELIMMIEDMERKHRGDGDDLPEARSQLHRD
jgi:hypothetical protein